MKCVIPSLNVKIMARAVHSLAKVGDEMFIQPSAEELILRTINLAKSAFAEFRMCRSFFSTFSYNDAQDADSRCKVTMKSFLSVFKGGHNLDKQVENCEIRLKSDTTLVIFLIKYSNASIKKYYLPIIESDQLEAQIPIGAPNQLAASSKFLSSSIKNFRHSEDEITLAVSPDKTVIKNHLELRRDLNLMRTELCFHQNEFESYIVRNPTNVTFCLKELRSVVTFAEPANLPVMISFTQPGRPIVFQVLNRPVYEVNYVVSTLNSNEAEHRLSISRTNVSPKITTPQAESNESQIRPDPFVFDSMEEEIAVTRTKSCSDGIPKMIDTNNEQVLNTHNLDSNNGDSNNKSPHKRKINPGEISSPKAKRRNTSFSELPNVESTLNESVIRTETSILKEGLGLKFSSSPSKEITLSSSKSVLPNQSLEESEERDSSGQDSHKPVPESEPGVSFHVFPGPSTAPDHVFKRPNSRLCTSQSSQPPPELLKTIFSRCFSKDHFLDALVGQDIILEESSDREFV